MKPSRGTVWPTEVRAHVHTHQPLCVGPLAGMYGPCEGSIELDHIRASGGIGLKSKSIATNAASMCSAHHSMKTNEGKRWRPRLIDVVRALFGDCAQCQEEWAREWAVAA